MLTFGQFYPGKDKKVVIFAFRYFQNPNLQLQLGLASQKLEGSTFFSHFPSVHLLHLTVPSGYALQHIFLSPKRQFLCTRVKKRNIASFFLRRILDVTVIHKSLASLPECLMERSLFQHNFRELGLGYSRTQCLVQYKYYLMLFNLDQAGLVSICSASVSTDPGYFLQNHSVV